jgi:5-methylcytosine-specific restriction endonuclease McrA
MLLQSRTLRHATNEKRPEATSLTLHAKTSKCPWRGDLHLERETFLNQVFQLNADKTPLDMVHPGTARRMLDRCEAAIYRRVPFTIIRKSQVTAELQPVALKVDPGSKTTGIALVADGAVVFAINLAHRGAAIKKKLEARRALRRGRRARHTRYRAPRFDNRRKPEGWLPPSLMSRVDNVASWAKRLIAIVPVKTIDVETVRFDMALMQNAEISGVEYQQGELAGYEVREYLLEKFNRTCAYCDKQNVPLEIEHVLAKSNGGSNRVSNLTLACRPCNVRKGNRDIHEFLDRDKPRLLKILANLKKPLRDAAAVNATRYAIGRALKATGLPTAFWSGSRTKMNRVAQGYAKDHWIDAACVGESGALVKIAATVKAIAVKAIGRGSRQMCRVDKFGFPRSAAKSVKRVDGYQTGDTVRLVQPNGKYAGTYVGSVAVRARGAFDLKCVGTKITSISKNFTLLQKTNGYDFAA